MQVSPRPEVNGPVWADCGICAEVSGTCGLVGPFRVPGPGRHIRTAEGRASVMARLRPAVQAAVQTSGSHACSVAWPYPVAPAWQRWINRDREQRATISSVQNSLRLDICEQFRAGTVGIIPGRRKVQWIITAVQLI